MSHVQIRTLETGATSVVVDGMEMALNILATDGVGVRITGEVGAPAEVRFTLLADTVDVDLAKAKVNDCA